MTSGRRGGAPKLLELTASDRVDRCVMPLSAVVPTRASCGLQGEAGLLDDPTGGRVVDVDVGPEPVHVAGIEQPATEQPDRLGRDPLAVIGSVQ